MLAFHADHAIFTVRLVLIEKGWRVQKKQKEKCLSKEEICCFASYLSSELPAGTVSLNWESLSTKDVFPRLCSY